MKVTTNTPDLLIVDDRPLFIGIMLILFILLFVGVGLGLVFAGEPLGLVFALMGGGLGAGAFIVFVRRVQVVFHRPEGYVEIRRKNAFRARKVRHALAEIDRAEVESSRTSEGATTYRTVLVIEAGQSVGRHPLTFAYSSGSGHRRVAEAINAWLSGPHPG
jgi:hypothetical protein